MFENQLEFRHGADLGEDILVNLLGDEEEECGVNNDRFNYLVKQEEEFKGINKNFFTNITEEESRNRLNVNIPVEEQLEYNYVNNNTNCISNSDYNLNCNVGKLLNLINSSVPKPLVYSKNEKKNKPGSMYIANITHNNKKKKTWTNKVFSLKKNKTGTVNRVNPVSNWNSAICSGLFDPNLKRNELNLPRRTEVQRKELSEKIKNYDIKFGSKTKKLEVYSNYMDLLENLEQRKLNSGKSNSSNSSNLIPRFYNQKNLDKIQELEARLPKPLKIDQNLDFDFASHEEVIRSLEEQIKRERSLREDINIKYNQKIKQLEALNAADKITPKPLNLNKPRVKKVLKRYGTATNFLNKSTRGSILGLNKSKINLKRKKNKFRNMSADLVIKEKMKEISPKIEQIIDRSFSAVYRKMQKNKKSGDEKLKLKFEGSKNPYCEYNNNPNNYNSPVASSNLSNYINPSYTNAPGIHNSIMMSPINPLNNTKLQFSSYEEDRNSNQNKNIYQNNNNNDNEYTPFASGNEMLSSNSANIQTLSKLGMLNSLNSLNKEIDSYNKGLPSLIQKVESTLSKINQSNMLNEKVQLHPIVKMAARSTGQSIHLHIEEIVDLLIDDLLLDTVNVLQEIEQVESSRAEYASLCMYVKDYYKDFELMKNFESDVTKKLIGKYNYNNSSEARALLNINNTRVISPAELTRNEILSYSNPFIAKKNKCYFKTELHPSILSQCQKYKKDYLEYMKTTGVFLTEDIFTIYDELTEEVVNDILEEELVYVTKQIDSFAADIYKEEVINLKQE